MFSKLPCGGSTTCGALHEIVAGDALAFVAPANPLAIKSPAKSPLTAIHA
jgi:hypothetical protein